MTFKLKYEIRVSKEHSRQMKQPVQKPRSREYDVLNQNVKKSGWSFLARSGLGVAPRDRRRRGPDHGGPEGPQKGLIKTTRGP